MEVQKKRKPRKPCYLVLALLLFVNQASAQTIMNDLIGLGMPAEQADYIAGIVPGGSTLSNNVFLGASNAAGSDTVPLIGLNASDDTVVSSDSGDPIILRIAEDAQRLFTFNASSDTALTLQFGDAGVTAAQAWSITASTADADDDSELSLSGGGSSSNSRGAYIALTGNEATPPGRITLAAGNVANAHIRLVTEDTSSTVVITDATSGDILTVANSGIITAARAADFNFGVGAATIGFQEATAGTACSGTATCNGATDVTTATTCATTGSRIFLQRSSADTDGVGQMYVKSISNGVNFVVNCVTANDTSTFNWVIFHESP